MIDQNISQNNFLIRKIKEILFLKSLMILNPITYNRWKNQLGMTDFQKKEQKK